MLLKFLREAKNEALGSDFFMWEHDLNHSTCRSCCATFGTFLRRHHCRLCGGVYCEPCTATEVKIGDETHERVCAGCIRGESPGDRIRGFMESRLKSTPKRTQDYQFTLRPVRIMYGSPFEPTAMSPGKGSGKSNSGKSSSFSSPPPAGYFEILNKSSSFCAIKIMINGKRDEYDSMWELPRPPYAPLPPNEIITANFGEETDNIEVFVLFVNSNPLPEDIRSVQYQAGVGRKLSPCAAIDQFTTAAIYRIDCLGHNVLFKYKGDGVVEPRSGFSFQRNGIGALFGSRKTEEGKLDFDTNITPADVLRLL